MLGLERVPRGSQQPLHSLPPACPLLRRMRAGVVVLAVPRHLPASTALYKIAPYTPMQDTYERVTGRMSSHRRRMSSMSDTCVSDTCGSLTL
jgi:hypothetical protein